MWPGGDRRVPRGQGTGPAEAVTTGTEIDVNCALPVTFDLPEVWTALEMTEEIVNREAPTTTRSTSATTSV